jgi:hypothetical protein
MSRHADSIRLQLASGPLAARQLLDSMGISQPTLSRALAELGGEIVRLGAARSIQYALCDGLRGLPDMPVYRVDVEGRIRSLGTLVPVRPEGFVMRQEDGETRYSDGLPWWLFDMRPSGYLGRAYAARHGGALGLPARLADWSDTHALRALLANGEDMVGNLLLGDVARDRFLAAPLPAPIAEAQKAERYAALAREAASGEQPGSSAGGEQPKFVAYAETPDGPRHVLVKFSEPDAGPVGERWRDLLLAEHLALETLREAGVPAATTRLIDTTEQGGGQRFLEVARFDRTGALGRRAVFSLSALDAEFVGAGGSHWPAIARRLVTEKVILPRAAESAALLWAFGTLIGNTDMHGGNLSFLSEQGPPCEIAPAYDMSPMAFAPRSGGGLPDAIGDAGIDSSVANETWRQAEALARAFFARVVASGDFSRRFAPCIAALERRIETAGGRIARLG